MGSKYGGIDTSTAWIRKKFEALEREIRELRAAKNAQATSIGRGGITIEGGGSLESKYASGATAAIIGPAYPDTPDDGSQIALLDDSGNVIFYTYRLPVSDANPAGVSAVYCVGDLVFLASPGFASQILLDPTHVSLIGGTDGVQIAHTTTASAANCYISPVNNQIYRSTSSLRYKRDIEDAEIDPAAVLQMQAHTFRDKAEVEKDPDTQARYVGFIAEELHDLGLGQFVVYDDEGPEAIAYDRLTVALLAVLKDQQRRLEALESANEAPAEP